MSPRVTYNVATISKQFEQDCRATVAEIEERFGAVNLTDSILAASTPYTVFGHRGAVPSHEDGNGYTHGVVIIADGTHVLHTEGESFLLEVGSVFLIDSCEQHWTTCSQDDGLLVFVVFDYLVDLSGREMVNNPPTMSDHKFAERAVASAEKYIRDGMKVMEMADE